jgi:hypothetical protein
MLLLDTRLHTNTVSYTSVCCLCASRMVHRRACAHARAQYLPRQLAHAQERCNAMADNPLPADSCLADSDRLQMPHISTWIGHAQSLHAAAHCQ